MSERERGKGEEENEEDEEVTFSLHTLSHCHEPLTLGQKRYKNKNVKSYSPLTVNPLTLLTAVPHDTSHISYDTVGAVGRGFHFQIHS